MTNVFVNPIAIQILEKYKNIRALKYMMSISNREMETYMPPGANNIRSQAHSYISTQIQNLLLDRDFVDLVNKLGNEQGLSDAESALYKILKKEIDELQKLPYEFVSEWTELTSQASLIWQEARSKSDFSIFAPYLEQIVDMCKKKIKYLGYDGHPYNVLLNIYENNLKVDICDKYFEDLKAKLLPLIPKIQSKFTQKSKLFSEYNIDKLKILNKKILDYLGFDDNHQRLDESAHPFSSGFNTQDLRITTKYSTSNFFDTIGSSIHEFGHSLYERQSSDLLNQTPICGGSSLVIHESQSRFWENCIGRSKAFLEIFADDIRELGLGGEKLSIDDIYHSINRIKPGFIRIEADEIYYHVHVIIRYEIEKLLIEGTIQVKDLPHIWNSKYKEYLGIDVPDDKQGVLQDVHWSFGLVGYFPTYSMGTALSIIRKNQIEKELGSIDILIKNKEGISSIRNRLKEKIHQYGSTYTLDELMKKNNLIFSSNELIVYLQNKYI